MKLPIALNLRNEPNFKCLILRLLIPFCELVDVLVSLFSLTILESNFGFNATAKYAVAYQKAKK